MAEKPNNSNTEPTAPPEPLRSKNPENILDSGSLSIYGRIYIAATEDGADLDKVLNPEIKINLPTQPPSEHFLDKPQKYNNFIWGLSKKERVDAWKDVPGSFEDKKRKWNENLRGSISVASDKQKLVIKHFTGKESGLTEDEINTSLYDAFCDGQSNVSGFVKKALEIPDIDFAEVEWLAIKLFGKDSGKTVRKIMELESSIFIDERVTFDFLFSDKERVNQTEPDEKDLLIKLRLGYLELTEEEKKKIKAEQPTSPAQSASPSGKTTPAEEDEDRSAPIPPSQQAIRSWAPGHEPPVNTAKPDIQETEPKDLIQSINRKLENESSSRTRYEATPQQLMDYLKTLPLPENSKAIKSPDIKISDGKLSFSFILETESAGELTLSATLINDPRMGIKVIDPKTQGGASSGIEEIYIANIDKEIKKSINQSINQAWETASFYITPDAFGVNIDRKTPNYPTPPSSNPVSDNSDNKDEVLPETLMATDANQSAPQEPNPEPAEQERVPEKNIPSFLRKSTTAEPPQPPPENAGKRHERERSPEKPRPDRRIRTGMIVTDATGEKYYIDVKTPPALSVQINVAIRNAQNDREVIHPITKVKLDGPKDEILTLLNEELRKAKEAEAKGERPPEENTPIKIIRISDGVIDNKTKGYLWDMWRGENPKYIRNPLERKAFSLPDGEVYILQTFYDEGAKKEFARFYKNRDVGGDEYVQKLTMSMDEFRELLDDGGVELADGSPLSVAVSEPPAPEPVSHPDPTPLASSETPQPAEEDELK